MTKKYPAKVSYGLLAFVFLAFFGPLVPILIAGEFGGKEIGVILFLTLLFAYILHLFLKTEYTIDENSLKIKCGVFSYKPIKIEEIKEISKTGSILSSPAPSLDRIKIKYGKFSEVIISPEDKSDFVNELKKINPNIKNKIEEK